MTPERVRALMKDIEAGELTSIDDALAPYGLGLQPNEEVVAALLEDLSVWCRAKRINLTAVLLVAEQRAEGESVGRDPP
jgi:hypothetical protein